jgi:hypothetical protein
MPMQVKPTLRVALCAAAVALVCAACTGSALKESGGGGGSLDQQGEDRVGDVIEPGEILPDLATDLRADLRAEVLGDVPADVGGCAPGVAGFGCPCFYNDDCASGHCVDHLGERVCSTECTGDCPGGFTCRLVEGFCPPCLYLCVSDMGHLCRPCHDDGDCAGLADQQDICLDYGPTVGRFCGGDCMEDGDCPGDYSCAAAPAVAGGTSLQCVHDDGICPCSGVAAALELTTSCASPGDDGACWGIRGCGAEGLGPCDAMPPGPELCFNGLDDDCDGIIDEPGLCGACTCGDGVCVAEPCGEAWAPGQKTCAPDCAVCGSETCDPGEGPIKCPLDCCGACGDGVCKGGLCGEGPETCVQDCEFFACGNGVCEPGENPVDCVVDCMPYACGNTTCEPGEDPQSCPEDCAASCGDCVCDGGESYFTCPLDCGFCGDGYCVTKCAVNPENLDICPADCCVPACGGLECGPDGCGGLCGDCGGGVCQQGSCCLPQCDGADCGDDGCGGSCGVCDDGLPCTAEACVAGLCAYDLSPVYCFIDGLCVPSGTVEPGNPCAWCWPTEEPGAWSPRTEGAACGGGVCQGGVCACTPDCAGKVCGDDGCGGTCGACGGQGLCVEGVCACTPDCGGGKACGDDGCGGSCGDCPPGEACNPGYNCVSCTPDCDGKACGDDDGCWGTCTIECP